MPEARHLVEHYFRHESGRLVASLVRAFGARHLGLVEDVVQAALMRAVSSWSLKGIPPDPSAWLRRVARNLAIDALRRDLRWSSLSATAQAEPVSASPPLLAESLEEIDDALLRMIFICCDNALPAESQVALALKTLCGFYAREIARALLTTEANVARRIGRAKEILRTRGLDADTLSPTMVQARMPLVQAVVYLLFNEGYCSTQVDQVVRQDLCEEAVRLATLLAEHPLTRGPDTAAFLALLLFHASRLDARLDGQGIMLLLDEQDRSRWDQTILAEAFRWFTRAADGISITRYHAEAWIAAEHCRARSFADTNWHRIVDAYDLLVKLAPSPIHELNRAIALAERDGPAKGWDALMAIEPGKLPDHYHLWAATAGELARRLGNHVEARTYIEQALQSAPTYAERAILQRRLDSLGERRGVSPT